MRHLERLAAVLLGLSITVGVVAGGCSAHHVALPLSLQAAAHEAHCSLGQQTELHYKHAPYKVASCFRRGQQDVLYAFGTLQAQRIMLGVIRTQNISLVAHGYGWALTHL